MSLRRPGAVTVEVLLTEEDLDRRLVDDARRGLAADPKDLPPKWFYDERGSALFERITTLPEYYPTRREREILTARAGEIAELARADTLVELGSGAAVKTRLLLDALTATGRDTCYVPFDVCEQVVRDSAAACAARYAGLAVRGLVGDFEEHLHLIPRWGPQLVAFLGGTIGNLLPAFRHAFLRGVRAVMEGGDHLLLGADLVKDPARLVAAYDDAAGVTAAFNLNVLDVLNRRLGAGFRPEGFAHVARWDPDEEWIEMRLRSTRRQRVGVPALDMTVAFGDGEEMRTEVSAKFRRDRLAGELGAAGFGLRRFWTDRAGDFSLVLAVAE